MTAPYTGSRTDKTRTVTNRGRLVVAVIGAALLAFAGANAAAPPPTGPTVEIKSFMFGMEPLTVKAGATVTWKNLDAEPHTVVSIDGTFRSGALDQGDTFSFTFVKPGTYRYLCSIHPQMVSKIIVTAPGQ